MDKEILEKLKNYDYVIGIDEVGRGPIAGPVTVAAVAISLHSYQYTRSRLREITDSKKISANKRNYFDTLLKDLAVSENIYFSLSSVSAGLIDRHGINLSLATALERSYLKLLTLLKSKKVFVYLDGSLFLDLHVDQETIIGGDAKNWLIGAASILAKVARDKKMVNYSFKYPEYFFEKNKGYGTKQHYESIHQHGLSVIHRRSWIRLDN